LLAVNCLVFVATFTVLFHPLIYARIAAAEQDRPILSRLFCFRVSSAYYFCPHIPSLISGPDLGSWTDCWVPVELLCAAIPRKGSGSATITFDFILLKYSSCNYWSLLNFHLSKGYLSRPWLSGDVQDL